MARWKAKTIAGIAIIAVMLAIWAGIGWYAITLVLGVCGVTGGTAVAITVACEGAFLALAVSVIRLVSTVAYGKDQS